MRNQALNINTVNNKNWKHIKQFFIIEQTQLALWNN